MDSILSNLEAKDYKIKKEKAEIEEKELKILEREINVEEYISREVDFEVERQIERLENDYEIKMQNAEQKIINEKRRMQEECERFLLHQKGRLLNIVPWILLYEILLTTIVTIMLPFMKWKSMKKSILNFFGRIFKRVVNPTVLIVVIGIIALVIIISQILKGMDFFYDTSYQKKIKIYMSIAIVIALALMIFIIKQITGMNIKLSIGIWIIICSVIVSIYWLEIFDKWKY